MKFQNITLILTLLGILILIFLTQTKPIQIGTISSIKIYQTKTIIQLKNHANNLVIFNTPNINLSKGDRVKFQGKDNIYKNKKQIIISKISKY